MSGKDGKKKRPKQSSSSSQTSSSSPPVSSNAPKAQPIRVSTDINIPIRRQIKYAQMTKQLAKESSPGYRAKNIQRTKYRKVLDESREEEMKLIRQAKKKEPDWDVILNGTLSSPLVIIDAYNVMHKHSKLKKLLNKSLVSKARETFIHDLEELRIIKGWRIEAVFDGGNRNLIGPLGSGPESVKGIPTISAANQEATKKVTSHGIRTVFSGIGNTADSYIEARCMEIKQCATGGKITNSLIVASDDAMIKIAATNAGAFVMSSQRIVDELKAMQKMISYKVEVAVAKNNGHDVRHEKLRNMEIPNMMNNAAGNQFLIYDKRQNKKKKKLEDNDEKVTTPNAQEIRQGTTSIPSWARLPPKEILEDK